MRYEFMADEVTIAGINGDYRKIVLQERSDGGWQLVAAFPDSNNPSKHHLYFQRPATTDAKTRTR